MGLLMNANDYHREMLTDAIRYETINRQNQEHEDEEWAP